MITCDTCGAGTTAKRWMDAPAGPLAFCEHHALQHAGAGYPLTPISQPTPAY